MLDASVRRDRKISEAARSFFPMESTDIGGDKCLFGRSLERFSVRAALRLPGPFGLTADADFRR